MNAAENPCPASAARYSGLIVAGVMGGVGSGKSTAARLLAEALNGPHLDADAAVAQLFQDPGLVDLLDSEFGGGLKTASNTLNRAKMGERIFAQPQLKERLEAILHPRVRAMLWQGLADAEAAEKRFAVLDVPLLLENGLHRACDQLIFVDVPDELRCARACARHGWDSDTWRKREAAQLPLVQKKSTADAILSNAGGVDDLRTQVAALLPDLRVQTPRPLRDRWPDPSRLPI